MPQTNAGDPPAADDDDDFKIAVRTVLLTTPHMTRAQLSDFAKLVEEIHRARADGDTPERLFARPRRRTSERRAPDRPPERRSFQG